MFSDQESRQGSEQQASFFQRNLSFSYTAKPLKAERNCSEQHGQNDNRQAKTLQGPHKYRNSQQDSSRDKKHNIAARKLPFQREPQFQKPIQKVRKLFRN